MASQERYDEYVEVTVNCQRVLLRAGRLAGLELRQEAIAQDAELQLGFDLWFNVGDQCIEVHNEDVITVHDGQEFLAITTDDHGLPLLGQSTAYAGRPAGRWGLGLPSQLWADLSEHLFGDGGDHAAVLLADQSPEQRTLLGRELITADDERDYVEGTGIGYRSLLSEFIRDAVLCHAVACGELEIVDPATSSRDV